MKDFLIGYAQDDALKTGVTVIISEKGAVCGVDVRGSAPGTRETDLLKDGALVEKVNAVVLSGGSAFGLEASCGVMEYLRSKKCGFSAGGHAVPIVCSAVIYDLDFGGFAYPDKKTGLEAAENASAGNFKIGNFGAGCGATVGKALGAANADKGGQGIFTVKFGSVYVTAIMVVNALGDIYDENNRIIAGARLDGGFADSVKVMLKYSDKHDGSKNIKPSPKPSNTTIGCVLTNAKLTKAQANKLAQVAHDGLACVIRPVHTMFDGDTVFAMSSCAREFDFNVLCVAAVEAVKGAVWSIFKKGEDCGGAGE
jgi:L-aminopeptidase/D-esterase-like protein